MINHLKLNDLPENVIPILAKSEHKFPLEDKISDFAILAFVTHENENIEMFLDEIKRITKDNGRIVNRCNATTSSELQAEKITYLMSNFNGN